MAKRLLGMRPKLWIFLFALPALVVAGAWTRVGDASAASNHKAAVITLAGHTSALFLGAIDWISQISEEACFLALGAGFVSLAWVLHRKSAKRRREQ